MSENELSEISTQHLATSRRLNRLYHHRWLHAFEVCIFRFRAIRMDEIPLSKKRKRIKYKYINQQLKRASYFGG
jgi:hypothetical protein